MATAILGTQWGDEGKGKLVDILAPEHDFVVRATGGANAGHTIYTEDETKFVFHLIPSGILHANVSCVIGNGCVVHAETLSKELENLTKHNVDFVSRLFISERAHMLFDYHKEIDGVQEARKAGKKIGTTKRGIGPCYADKINRIGIRFVELKNWEHFKNRYTQNLELHKRTYPELEKFNGADELQKLQRIREIILPLIRGTVELLQDAMRGNKKILFEGANATLLDIDHGTYPYVTSSNASIGGQIAGSGVHPQAFKKIIGIAKAYTTRVGSGPFPTELTDSVGETLQKEGAEFGATTGRPRRCGWLDAVITKHSIALNGVTELNLTKLDVLNQLEKIKICTSYKIDGQSISYSPSSLDQLEKAVPQYIELDGWMSDTSNTKSFSDLPNACQTYVKTIEEILGRPITYIGVGKKRNQIISL